MVNLAAERTNFARYIPHYTQFGYGLLYRPTIPFLVGPSEETEVIPCSSIRGTSFVVLSSSR